VFFLTVHLAYPSPSPAIFEKIGTAFRRAVRRFADEERIPVVRFGKNDRLVPISASRVNRGTARLPLYASGASPPSAPSPDRFELTQFRSHLNHQTQYVP